MKYPFLINPEDETKAFCTAVGSEITQHTHPAEWSAYLAWRFDYERKLLLADCDWTDLPSCRLSPAKIAEWQAYRQALRDLKAVLNFNVMATITEVVWPTPPT